VRKEKCGLNRNTARAFYHRLRQLIASKLPSYDLSGEVEADESYLEVFAKANMSGLQQGRCPCLASYSSVSNIDNSLWLCATRRRDETRWPHVRSPDLGDDSYHGRRVSSRDGVSHTPLLLSILLTDE